MNKIKKMTSFEDVKLENLKNLKGGAVWIIEDDILPIMQHEGSDLQLFELLKTM